MAIVTYKGVGISALSACVPSRIIDNYHYGLDIWSESEVKKVVDKVGVKERRFVDERTCASDLCFAAAERLFRDNDIDRREIDLLVSHQYYEKFMPLRPGIPKIQLVQSHISTALRLSLH